MSLHTSPSPALHRIHHVSPLKEHTPKRIFDMATEEGTVVWKARSVACAKVLLPGEVYITHYRVRDDVDCNLLLVKIDALETVIVSESLGALGEEVDVVFQSLSKMSKYRDDVKIIMSHIAAIPGLQLKGSFCRFAYAIYVGCREDGQSYEAIQRSGMDLFWDVLQNLAEDKHPSNLSLRWLSECKGDSEIIPLHAFVEMFKLLQERHKISHPFNFICGDVDLADAALQILKYLVEGARRDKFADVSCLIRAAIPILEAKIKAQRINNLTEKEQLQLEMNFILARLPKRK